MKLNYLNISLYSFSLNVLSLSSEVYNQRNHYITLHTPNTKAPKQHRLLCECELYQPSNYDNDPEMKAVMKDFDRQISQRFKEYDERMQSKRMQCKEQCDKEIQKIILKDKIEKELAEQFSALETKIDTNNIPTCVCEKSLADKMEKECLKCAQNLGGIVAPSTGVLGEIAALAVNAWKTEAIVAATKYALAEGAAVGKNIGDTLGKKAVIVALQHFEVDVFFPKIFNSIGNAIPYYDAKTIGAAIAEEHAQNCALVSTNEGAKCYPFEVNLGIREAITFKQTGPPGSGHIRELIKEIVGDVKKAADARTAEVSSATYKDIMTKQTAFIEAEFNSSITSIYAPIIAIVVIVLIMIIIYLILRYRRKKKMKKKLQYIKLLEE